MLKFLTNIFKSAPKIGVVSDPNNYSPFRDRSFATTELLMRHYDSLIYTLANINATAVSSTPWKLYVSTAPGQDEPRVPTRVPVGGSNEVREVLQHPFLDLMKAPNPEMSGVDLLELTQLNLELAGDGYWFVDKDSWGTPSAIWLLPAQTIVLKRNSNTITYEYTPVGGGAPITYRQEQIIHFRMLNAKDPYNYGYSPTRAAWDQVEILDSHIEHARNAADGQPPAVMAVPLEPLNSTEAKRIEANIRYRLRTLNGSGVFVTERGFKLEEFPRTDDTALLAQIQHYDDAVTNIFQVPLSYLSKDSNLANLTASRMQHTSLAVAPRCNRLASKITNLLQSAYDPRLSAEFDSPIIEDEIANAQTRKIYTDAGIMSINEVRVEMGLKPIEGMDKPERNQPKLPGATNGPE